MSNQDDNENAKNQVEERKEADAEAHWLADLRQMLKKAREEEMEEEARRRVAEIFASEVMLTDADEARRLIEHGICVRIALPPELFQS